MFQRGQPINFLIKKNNCRQELLQKGYPKRRIKFDYYKRRLYGKTQRQGYGCAVR